MRHSKPVRLENVPTGPDKSGSKPMGESVYLFLEFTIITVFLLSLVLQLIQPIIDTALL